MIKPSKTAALYARFSSDMQKERSIEDQLSVCRRQADREGYKVVTTFVDKAKSGTSMFDRDGLRDLMAAARKKDFDVLVVEATDRLARSQADIASIFERLQFFGVKIVSTTQGEISEMHVAIAGIGDSDFIKKLAARVKRGHDGIAREGKIAGANSYGYDLVPGKPGERTINQKEAAILRRIFTEYADGTTPRQIVAGLARDRIASPVGAAFWNYQGIVGGLNKRGLLHNRLYIGEYVKNRFHNVKDPETGKRITRKSADDDLIVAAVPHLRIVSQKLWDAAHKVRMDRAVQKFGASGYTQRAVVPRKQQLLAGLLRCGECSGLMSTTASSRKGQRVGCSSATYRRTCKHTKTYDLGALTSLVVDNMNQHLTDPEFLKERAKARTLEFARQMKEDNGARQEAQRKLDRLNIQIARLVAAIEDSDQPVKELMASIKTKEIERVSLQERVRLLGAESNVTVLHPAAVKAFGRNIETLNEKLKRKPDDPECRLAFGNIVERIIVHPTSNGQPYDVSLYARLSAVMGGVDLFPAQRSHQEIVAAEAFPRVSGQAGVMKRSRLNRNEETGVILLGRWRAAA